MKIADKLGSRAAACTRLATLYFAKAGAGLPHSKAKRDESRCGVLHPCRHFPCALPASPSVPDARCGARARTWRSTETAVSKRAPVPQPRAQSCATLQTAAREILRNPDEFFRGYAGSRPSARKARCSSAFKTSPPRASQNLFILAVKIRKHFRLAFFRTAGRTGRPHVHAQLKLCRRESILRRKSRRASAAASRSSFPSRTNSFVM